jgi:TonB family protein
LSIGWKAKLLGLLPLSLFLVLWVFSEVGFANCENLDLQIPDHPPAFKDSIPFEYPPMAARAQLEGEVHIRIVVSSEGKVCDLDALDWPAGILVRAALDAARNSTYFPGTVNGVPVDSEFRVVYDFNLQNYDAPNLRPCEPHFEEQHPLISELGERISKEGNRRDFLYKGISFYGDMPLIVFEEALRKVEPLLLEGEVITIVKFDPGPKTWPDDVYSGDLEISTCTEKNRYGKCFKGRVFSFINCKGTYEFMERGDGGVSWIE